MGGSWAKKFFYVLIPQEEEMNISQVHSSIIKDEENGKMEKIVQKVSMKNILMRKFLFWSANGSQVKLESVK